MTNKKSKEEITMNTTANDLTKQRAKLNRLPYTVKV